MSRASQSGWLVANRQSAISPPRQTLARTRPITRKQPALAHSESEEPMAMPETPQIPTVSRLPDLTEANGSDRLVVADDHGLVKAKPVAAPAPPVLPTLVPGPDPVPLAQDGAPKLAAQVAEPATTPLSVPVTQKPVAAGSAASTDRGNKSAGVTDVGSNANSGTSVGCD